MSTLLKAISDSDTTLMISPDAVLPTDLGLVQIGDEQISYDTLYMGTLYGCTRGVNSTSAASHVIGSTVTLSAFYHSESDEAKTVTALTVTGLTASRAVTSDANKALASSTTSATELSYVTGVTSAIQTQLNAKQASLGYTAVNKAGDTMTGAFVPWVRNTTQRDALFTVAVPSGTITYGTPSNTDTIVLTGLPTDGPKTFTKVAAGPGAGEFSNKAELTALINGLTDLNASEAGGVITLVVATPGTAMNAATVTGTGTYSALSLTFSGAIQPVAGTLIYNSQTAKLNVFTTIWEAVTSA